MSTTVPTLPVAETAIAPLPPERRTLITLLAGVESLLLVAAGVLAYLYRPQPVPVYGGPPCIQPPVPGGASPSGPYPYPCGPTDTTAQVALLVAAACAMVALLVLPPVMGALSRRWQTALAAPSIPVWLAVLVVVALALVTSFSASTLYPSGGSFNDLYPGALVLTVAGPLLSVLFVVAGLGGLGWLARRAFAR